MNHRNSSLEFNQKSFPKNFSNFCDNSTVWTHAQEKAADLKVDVNVDKGGSSAGMMSNPILWVAGGLIIILIVALAARGGGSSRA